MKEFLSDYSTDCKRTGEDQYTKAAEKSERTQKENRVGYIDFIKCIALTGIILAHVGSPNIVMMLRSFDVPCMVILSSLLASYSYKKRCTNILSVFKYLFTRFKRLVFPTWIFLTLYFGMNWILSGHPYDVKYYLASYFLTKYGIGYVWIILVYLYCAVLVPLFHKIGFNYKSAILIIVSYLLYEIAYQLQFQRMTYVRCTYEVFVLVHLFLFPVFGFWQVRYNQ